jgi:hypothetical protein
MSPDGIRQSTARIERTNSGLVAGTLVFLVLSSEMWSLAVGMGL